MPFRAKMVLQKLIALLLNHPQVGPRLVEKVQDTYLIRRAARATAYLYLRGRHALEEAAKQKAATIEIERKRVESIKRKQQQEIVRISAF